MRRSTPLFSIPRARARRRRRAIWRRARFPWWSALSCNPQTFARDARILVDGGYLLESVTPVDQFRHSPHVELVAVFRRQATGRRKGACWGEAPSPGDDERANVGPEHGTIQCLTIFRPIPSSPASRHRRREERADRPQRHGALSRRAARAVSRQGALRGRPGSTEEVAAILNFARRPTRPSCRRRQYGPRGRADSGQEGRQNEVLLSLKRMDRIREIDPASMTMTVEAGLTLLRVQEEAEKAGGLFPLSLASEGSCTIGGNLATNAGGTAVSLTAMRAILCRALKSCWRRARSVKPVEAQEGQHRLRPEAPVHGLGRHAWNHHRGCRENVSAPQGAGDGVHRHSSPQAALALLNSRSRSRA